jgi:hypothetical protein
MRYCLDRGGRYSLLAVERGKVMAKKRKAKRRANCRKNPKQLLFRTKKAAAAYAKAHGAKRFSVRKLKRGRA